MDEEDNTDELMPEIIEATQNEITSEEEEESEQEDIIEPKQDIEVNDMFEDSDNNKENDEKNENIEEKPIEPLFVKKVKNETEPKENKKQVEFIETVKKNIKGSTNENSQKRKKQLEHLRMMRERKKQLAEERSQQQEPKTPRPKKERPRTPEERPRTPEEKNIVKFNPDELEDFMENIAIKSIQKYKEQKKAKEKKKAVEKPPSPKLEAVRPPNPINNIVNHQWREEDLYANFF